MTEIRDEKVEKGIEQKDDAVVAAAQIEAQQEMTEKEKQELPAKIHKKRQAGKWLRIAAKLVFLIAVMLVYVYGMQQPYKRDMLSTIEEYEMDSSSYKALEWVSEDAPVEWIFKADSNYLYSVGLTFFTYNDSVADGEVRFGLYTLDDQLIAYTKAEYEELTDGSYYSFDVNTPLEKGAEYKIRVSAYSASGKMPPAIWTGTPGKGAEHTVVFAGESTQGVLMAEFEYRYLNRTYIAISIGVFFCIVLLMLLRLPDKKLLQRILTPVVLVVFPYLTFCLVESLSHNPFEMQSKTVMYNYLLYLGVYLIAFVITNRVRWAVVIGNTLPFIVGVANYYVLQFRGTPICPWDLMSLGTAATVADNYVFEIPIELITKILIAILIDVFAFSLYGRCKKLWLRLSALGGTVVYITVVLVLFIGSGFLEKEGFVVNLWQQAVGYEQNGYVLSFVMNMKYLKVEKPEGYSVEAVQEILEPYEETVEEQSVQEKPNIIVVMNEAFSDLTVIDEFETNRDYMSHIRRLKRNAVKGNLYMSIFGGGTCNSEYEVLTGNSMAFLASNSIAYQQYISSSDTTGGIVRSLKELGYTCSAIHPMEGSNWNRTSVYEAMGFDEFYDITTFRSVTRVRGSLISDMDTYNKIIDIYENKKEGEPMFVFDVTVQNHGGYSGNAVFDEEDTVKITSGEEYPAVEEYLSLLKLSDDAFAELVKYFRDVEEPTMIVMFGDHQPSIGDEFYEEMMGKPLSEWTLEEMQSRYEVPFVLWTNYDIEKDTVEAMSANYLSTLIFKYAGLPMPKYLSFQQEMYEQLPVINSLGYMDKEGTWYEWGEESPYEELLEKYRYLHYNSAIDKGNSYLEMYTYGK